MHCLMDETIPRRSDQMSIHLGTRMANKKFGGKTQSTRLKEAQVEELYRRLSDMCQTPEVFYFIDLELRGGEVCYRNKSIPLMTGGGS